MENVNGLYTGRPFGSVATICKQNDLFSVIDRTIAIKLCDQNDKITQIICSAYMSYYDQSNSIRTETFINIIGVFQSFIDRLMWRTL